jgi:EmrB/QacA subfamily drug resistance transporter
MNRTVSRDYRYEWSALIAVSLGTFLDALDVSIITVGLPALTVAFKTDSSVIGWVNIAYLVTSQSLMFSFARIGDASGRKRMYSACLALYTVGLLLCSLSRNAPDLIAARAIQGVGAAGVISLSTAIAVAVLPQEERGKALGILTSVSAIGLIAGPMVGGLILDLLGWRAIFYIRLPVGILGLITAWVIVREQKEPVALHFDLGGAMSLFGCLTSMLLFFNLAGKRGFLSTPNLLLAGSTLLLLGIFLLFESRAAQPIIDLRLFRNRVLAGAAAAGTVHAAVLTGSIFLLPFYLTEGLGYSARMVGLSLAIVGVAFFLLSPISGKMSDRFGPRLLSALGMSLACVALLFLSRLGSGSTALAITVGLCIIGISYAVFVPPNYSAIIGSVPRDRFGTASAIVSVARQVGSSSGIAVAGTLFASRLLFYSDRLAGRGLDAHLVRRMSVIGAFQHVLFLAAVFGIAGVVALSVRGPRKGSGKTPVEKK